MYDGETQPVFGKVIVAHEANEPSKQPEAGPYLKDSPSGTKIGSHAASVGLDPWNEAEDGRNCAGGPGMIASGQSNNKPYAFGRSLIHPFDLDEYIIKHRVSGLAEQFLRGAAKAPSRSPNGYFSSTVRYPCPYSGHTIVPESRRFEFPFILTITTRPDVLRVFEQGPLVTIRGKTEKGRPYTFNCTVDAVVCTTSGVEIYEVMDACEVAELVTSNRHRFQEIGTHKYGSRPAAEYFGHWGFKHFIVTQHDLSPGYVQAADFLRPYRIGHAQPPLTQGEVELVLKSVAETPGIFLEDINIEPHPRRAEVVYHLLAKGEIFTHLSEGRLTKQNDLRLYPTCIQEQAFQLLRSTSHKSPVKISDFDYQLRVGSLVEIKGKEYRVTKLDRSSVTLVKTKDDSETTLSFAALFDLKPLIGRIYFAEKTFEARLREASPEALINMFERHTLLQRCSKEVRGHRIISTKRSVRRWRGKFKKQEVNGVGLDALLDRRSGNTEPRIDEKVYRLLSALIERYYLTPNGETATWIFLRLYAINRRFRLGETPTYRTVARHCKAVDNFKKKWARDGKRGAERYKPVYPTDPLLGSPAGTVSWHNAHCDSTACDLLTTEDGKVSRGFLIKLVDSFDGRVLAHVLTDIAPSEKTARWLLNDCLRRHRMLPVTITFDWGVEGKSTWIQTTMEKLGVTLIFRPKTSPGTGANIETMFRKLCTELLHNLSGSTKLLQKARMITKAVNPWDRAVWTMPEVRKLLEEYYELINDLPRRNRKSPNAMAQASIAKFGKPPTQISEIEAFRIMLLPLVEGTTRVVSRRGCVRCQDHSYYHDDLRAYAGKEVVVRFDEDDIQHVYVSLPNKGQRTLCCEIVDTSLRYLSRTEANEEHADVRRDARARSAEVIDRRATLVATTTRKQKALTAAETQRKAKKAVDQSRDLAQPPRPPMAKVVALPLQFTRLV